VHMTWADWISVLAILIGLIAIAISVAAMRR
jgi:hypothetical protein